MTPITKFLLAISWCAIVGCTGHDDSAETAAATARACMAEVEDLKSKVDDLESKVGTVEDDVESLKDRVNL